ncbi:MAG: hypothetical protein SGI89_15620 [bacterium]|nr:hypothetical protein [bacterium]
MTNKIFVILTILFISAKISFSQNSKWINYTDFKNISSIASDNTNSNLYCASSGGLYIADAATEKIISKFTNLNGLINNELTALIIDNNRRLWIGASDGSISILDLQTFEWSYIFDIKNSTETNKAINYFYQSGNFMFIATGYGIQKVSAINFSFIDAPYYKLGNYTINTPVYSITANNNILYAATKAGVAYANLSLNLNNPQVWTNFNGLSMFSNVKTIESYDNKIFAGSTTGFDYFDGINWQPYPNSNIATQNTKFIKSASGKLYFISGSTVYFTQSTDLNSVTQFLPSNNYSTLTSNNLRGVVAGLSDNGIMINNDFVFPNGPFTNIFNQIVIDENNSLWAAGGVTNAGFYDFDGSEWENYNRSTHPEIGNSDWFQKIRVGNGNVWALGYGGGPTLIQGSTVFNYNTTNSILPGIPSDPAFCASSGGSYDNSGVFWVSFFSTNTGRSLYAFVENQWIGFVNPSILGQATLSDIAVDSYNTKWIVSSGSRSGVYFFNENGTLTNPADDVSGFYDNASLGGDVTNVNSVIIEKNNEVWIATNNGVFIINNPLAAVQNPNQPPAPQKLGIISGNLKVPFTENCISITNDILNDKWIGTETNGVFHLSPDGSTLIEQLNTAKTPILSNKIISIAVSTKTGRAYFGTQKGLSSYATDAIEPVTDFDKIIASPNPYLVPSDVNLKIDGLIENSKIKIVSLSGTIIDEFDSPGGRIAFWDGRDDKNEVAPTGIYIIIAYNKDGSKVGTGKVAVVKK